MTQHINVGLEIKALNRREFEGHGSIFGNVDLGGDVVVPGAFSKSLAEHKAAGTLPQMFWMHDPAQVPGKWTEMHEDEKGLFVKGELANTQLGNEMHELLKIKAVRGLSIGYMTTEADYDKDGNRLIKGVDLWETSLVSLAMNPLAMVTAAKARLSPDGEYVPPEDEQARILREAIADGKKAFERSLRDAGYSRKTAQTLIARHFEPGAGAIPASPRSDCEDEAAALLKAMSAFTEKVQAEALSTAMRRFG